MNKYKKYLIILMVMLTVRLIMGYVWTGEIMVWQVIVDIPEQVVDLSLMWLIFRIMFEMDKEKI
jgi:hypothetical protein